MKKLFISYSHADKKWTYRLWRALRDEMDYDAWIDQRIVPATDWWATVLENIETCDCFIYVMTPKAIESIYCQAEVNYALALNRPILPLMLKTCAYPAALKRIHYDTIGDGMSLEKVLLRIEKSLRQAQADIGLGKYPPKTAPRPAEPKPRQNPVETFALAEEAAQKANFTLAESLFQQVIETGDAVLSIAAQELLNDVRWERERREDYQNQQLVEQ